ncbi:MAG: CHAP domain-containing protein [Lachnospiraceae bacterium]|nr:CHAP domain-containing protein [Lachnospiraceae bacterium]
MATTSNGMQGEALGPTLIINGATRLTAYTKSTLASYQNKTIPKNDLIRNGEKALKSSELVRVGARGVRKAESELGKDDSLANSTASGVIKSARAATATFKTAQTIVSATPKVVKAGAIGVAGAGLGVAATAVGTYQVATQVGLTTVTVVNAYNMAAGMQVFPISKQAAAIFKAEAVQSGLSNTFISRRVTNAVNTIQTRMVNTVDNIRTGVTHIRQGINTAIVTGRKAYTIVRGTMTGALSVSYAIYKAETFVLRNVARALPYAQAGLGLTVRGTLVGAKWVTKGAVKVAKTGVGVARTGAVMGAGLLKSTDNYALQGVGHTIQLADTSYRLGKSAIKTGFGAGKAIVKTGIKTGQATMFIGKTAYNGLAFARANGLRKAWSHGLRRIRSGAFNAAASAGSSIVSFLINNIKSMASRVILPILLIVVIASGGLTVLSAPVTIVANMFSGIFSFFGGDDEFSVREFMTDPSHGIPKLAGKTRQELADDMANDWKSNGGSYDIVRLRTDAVSGTGVIVEPTLAGVSSAFYTDDEIIEMLEPLFNAVILMKYDLEPTEGDAKDELKDMYNKIFTITHADSTEYCGQNLIDGSGIANLAHGQCHHIHAILSGVNACPHIKSEEHASYICDDCCYYTYTCNGRTVHDCNHGPCDDCAGGCTHSCGWTCFWNGSCTHVCDSSCDKYCGHSCGSSCYKTVYCTPRYNRTSNCGHSCTSTHHCNGYSYCDSHKVKTYTLNMQGIYALVDEIFLTPINDLAGLTNPTQDDKDKLANLKDYYEIYENMMAMVSHGTYGGGLQKAELNSVVWESGSRTGNSEVVDLALTQVGNVGGRTYWTYYGFPSRVEWCACFVHWCMRKTPSATSAYPTTSNNAYCQTLADYFDNAGQFTHDYSNIAPGDCIFFDWQCDGHTDHIGIIIGRDNDFVYTVEGNSGDAVKIKKYSLHASVIYGYAQLNY